MSTKTRIHRAWCDACRSFTDHRKAPAGSDMPDKLECIACHDGDPHT